MIMDQLVIKQLVGQAMGSAIGSLIGAFVVQIACKMVAGFKPVYARAYFASLLGYLGAFFVGSLIQSTLEKAGQEPTGSTSLLLFAAAFVVQASIYSKVISHPQKGGIGFGRACIVSFIQFLFGGVVMAVLLILKANTA
jgi:hypothetical protein